MANRTRSIPLARIDTGPRSLDPGDTSGSWAPRASSSVLEEFVRNSQPWSRQQVPLPHRLRFALWALVVVQIIWGASLLALTAGAAQCDGPICTAATLNHHEAVLLAFAAVCVASLAGLVPVTRGLSQCGGREAAGIGIAAAAGAIALFGIATILVAAVIVLIILLAFVAAFTASA